MRPEFDCTLYVCTDRRLMSSASVEESVQKAIRGGARKLLGADKIIGVSAAEVKEAQKALEEGADYLGVGAMYGTSTKTDTRPVTMETLAQIRQAVEIPIVVIGGIGKGNAMNFRRLGIDGIAVVSSVVAQPDVEAAAAELKKIFLRGAAV